MTIEEILKLEPEDVMRLKRNELATVVRTANAVANKRLKRLEKNEMDTPAALAIRRSGGNFSTKGKSLNQLRAEYMRVTGFLNAKTSTVRGANATLKQIASSTNISYKRVGELNSKLSKFFDLYSKVEQYLQNSLQIANAVGSDTVMQVVSDYVRDQEQTIKAGMTDYKDMVESISKVLATKYIEQAENNFADDFTDLF